MKWLKNIENISENKKVGKCPFCSSDDTDYTLIGEVDSYGYGEIWCNNCKSAYHLSRIKISKDFNINKSVPQNLRY